MREKICYEYSMQEWIRVFLRLEYSLAQFHYHKDKVNYFSVRSAVHSFIDILNVLDRPDFRSKATQELLRYKDKHFYGEKPPIPIPEKWLEAIHFLETKQGKIGQELREEEFLYNIQFALSRPGGGWSFDFPLYHYWLEQEKDREQYLKKWAEALKPIESMVTVVLNFIRNSGKIEERQAEKGMVQDILDPRLTYALIQLWIDPIYPMIPEMSFGKHRLTLRFLDVEYKKRPQQTVQTIPYLIKVCLV